MNNSFFEPTKQSLLGIIINFLNTSQKVLKVLIPLFLVFIGKSVSVESFSRYGNLFLIALVILITLLFYSYLKYKYFFFYIDQATNNFVLNEGVINQSKVFIPLDKIQDVHIKQTFIDQLITVFRVEINSAGNSSVEVVIPAMTLEAATLLKEALLQGAVSDSEGKEGSQEKVEMNISVLTLIKVGLVSNYIATTVILVATFNFLLDKLRRLKMFMDTEDMEGISLQWGDYRTSVYWAVGIGVLFIIIFLLLNIIRTLIKYWNYTIAFSANVWHISFGLFYKKSVLLKPARVQILSVTYNYFSKLIGLYNISIKQIGGVDEKNKNEGIVMPGCSSSEQQQVLAYIYGQEVKLPRNHLALNPLFLIVRLFLVSLLPAVLMSAISFVESNQVWLLVSIIYLTLTAALVQRYYKMARFYYSKDLIVIRTGIWDITYRYLTVDKIQSIVVKQYFWQRRKGLGSITIKTAGGYLFFSSTSYNKLKELRDSWITLVESSDKSWM